MAQLFQIGDRVKLIPPIAFYSGGIWTMAEVQHIWVKFANSPKHRNMVYGFRLSCHPFRSKPIFKSMADELLFLDEKSIKMWRVKHAAN